MQYRQLLNSGMNVSQIGLGCASYWGKQHFSEAKAIDVVHHAIDSGVNYFDTGHSYSGGYAEVRLGKALKGKTPSTPMILSSKVGTRVGHFGRLFKDFSASWIRASCEQSLRQLNVDHLPVFFLHGPNPCDFNDEVYLVLEGLQQSGKVGLLGVNAFDDNIIQMAVDSKQYQCVMLDFNILSPHRMATIESLHAHGIDVMVAGAIAGGLYDKRFKRFRGMRSIWYWLRAIKNNRTLLRKARHFNFLNDYSQASAVQLALAYVLDNQKFCTALIGTTSAKHLEELLCSSQSQMTPELMNQIITAQEQFF